MRRQPLVRPENVLALAVAEIERIKALLSRVTDGRSVVVETGTGPGDTTVPIETGTHTLYGVKHTRSFRVTDGGGLDVDYEQGQIWMGGSFYSVGAGSLTLDDNATNYVFINNAGAVAYNATGFPGDCWPMALVTTVAGDITALADRRSYAAQVIGGGIVLGNPLYVGTDDSARGRIGLYGDGMFTSDGGEAQFYLAAAHDGAFEYWIIQAYEDDLRIQRSDYGAVPLTITAERTIQIYDANFILSITGGNPRITVDANDYGEYDRAGNYFTWVIGSVEQMRVDSAGQLQLPITGAGAGILIGGDVQLYRGAANRLDLPSGDFIQMDGGGLVIGPEAAIVFDGTDWTPSGEMGIGEAGGTLYLQGRNDMTFVVDPANIGARNFYWYHGADLTGGTLLMQLAEDGLLRLPITGSGAGLLLGGDVQLYRSAASTLYTPDSMIIAGGQLQFGIDDTASGRLILWGDNAGLGGRIDLFMGAAQDTTWNYWQMRILNDDDLQWRVVTPGGAETERMRLVAEGQLQIPTVGSGAGILIGGDVQLYRSAANILYIPDSVAITGDLYFESDGSGLPYGHMHGYNIAETVGVAFAETWYELTAGLTGGETNLATFANNHELTVTKAGRYLITWSMSVRTGTAQDEIEGTVAVNNTANTTAAAHGTLVKANASIVLAGTTILDLAASDDISMAVLNHTAARDIVVEHVTCSVVMVGGT